jgi:hypothetical protein
MGHGFIVARLPWRTNGFRQRRHFDYLRVIGLAVQLEARYGTRARGNRNTDDHAGYQGSIHVTPPQGMGAAMAH